MDQPKKKLEEATVVGLASAGCSTSDIALIANCSERTLHKRFSKIIARVRGERRWWLLDQQNAAEKGNATILPGPATILEPSDRNVPLCC